MAVITKEEAEALIKAAKEEAEAAAKAEVEAEAALRTTADEDVAEQAAAEVTTAKGEIKAATEIRKKLEDEYAAGKILSAEDLSELGEANAAILSLGIKFKGDYSEDTHYLPGDVVVFEGGSYLCLEKSFEEPPTEETTTFHWFFRGQA